MFYVMIKIVLFVLDDVYKVTEIKIVNSPMIYCLPFLFGDTVQVLQAGNYQLNNNIKTAQETHGIKNLT